MRARLSSLWRHVRTALVCCIGYALWALPHLAQAQAADMSERTRACTACHGEQGRAGPDGYYPRLAGKPADYLFHQLQNFQQGRRHYSPMQHLIAPLSEDYLRAMAEHFASQHPPYPAPPAATASAQVLARGKALVFEGDASRHIPACVHCHGHALTGVLPAVPGLLGLPRDYLNAQLGGWQTGQRHAHAPDCMAAIAKRLNDADVHALSQWLATQPVPAPSAAVAQRPARAGATAPLPTCGSAP